MVKVVKFGDHRLPHRLGKDPSLPSGNATGTQPTQSEDNGGFKY